MRGDAWHPGMGRCKVLRKGMLGPGRQGRRIDASLETGRPSGRRGKDRRHSDMGMFHSTPTWSLKRTREKLSLQR